MNSEINSENGRKSRAEVSEIIKSPAEGYDNLFHLRYGHHLSDHTIFKTLLPVMLLAFKELSSRKASASLTAGFIMHVE